MQVDDRVLQDLVKQTSQALRLVLPQHQVREMISAVKRTGYDDETSLRQAVEYQIASWLKHLTQQAKQEGYYPFILFSKETYQAFTEYFGDWSFPFMEKYLHDPSRVSPYWAAQFVTALDLLDPDAVAEQQDVYAFVIQSPEFLVEGRRQRRAFLKFLRSRRFEH